MIAIDKINVHHWKFNNTIFNTDIQQYNINNWARFYRNGMQDVFPEGTASAYQFMQSGQSKDSLLYD